MIWVFLAFFIPVCGAIQLPLVGSITPGEIVLVMIAPLFLTRIQQLMGLRQVRWILALFVIYLLAQIFSDYYRGTPPKDFLRGWARIAMTMFSFVVLSALLGGNRARILAFIAGLTIANVVGMFLGGLGADASDSDVFKNVLGAPIVVASFVAAGYVTRFRFFARLAPASMGVLAFLMNARSMAGLTLLSWAGLYLLPKSPTRKIEWGHWRMLVLLIGLPLVALGLFQFYKFAAPRGYLGSTAKAKYQIQASRGGQGFSILKGRNEIYYAWPKIQESPFIGWGSWAKDVLYVYNKSLDVGFSPEFSWYFASRNQGLIPTHSHIFGSWLEAGFFGALLWIVVIVLMVRIMLKGQLSCMGKLEPVFIFIFISEFWDILFSPFAGPRRVSLGFFLWMLVYIPLLAQHQLKHMDARKARASARGPVGQPS